MQFPIVSDFAQVLEFSNYAPVPDTWLVAVADVVGSTPAIAAGRYKDVNLAGAATIAALQNACSGVELCYAFGGDGSVVLIPAEFEVNAREALQSLQKVGRETLDLNIRCALVPLDIVRKAGHDIRVTLHDLGSGRKLAMMAGGGIDFAESICKSHACAFGIIQDHSSKEADLSGLSCRWQPLKAQRGVMLSLIICVKGQAGTLSPIYREIHLRISEILGHDYCPVSSANLQAHWPPRGANIERKMGHSLFTVYGQSLLATLSEQSGSTIGGFDGRNYRKSIATHSDYRKFADSLRMVIDCSQHEANRIGELLAIAQSEGKVDFGLHRASSALMTCFVSATVDGGHVHFIDGADGGYALAAQGLKAGSSLLGAPDTKYGTDKTSSN